MYDYNVLTNVLVLICLLLHTNVTNAEMQYYFFCSWTFQLLIIIQIIIMKFNFIKGELGYNL